MIVVPRAALNSLQTRIKGASILAGAPILQGDNVLLSRALAGEWLQLLNVSDMQRDFFSKQSALTKRMQQNRGPSPVWGRLRALSPKAAGSLSHLMNSNNRIVTDAVSVEAEVRSSRGFWLDKPDVVSGSLLEILQNYATQSSNFGDVPLPPPAEFLPTILASSDSSPGIDGIPYSVYRLVPAESSELLHLLLKTICHKAHTLRVPNP